MRRPWVKAFSIRAFANPKTEFQRKMRELYLAQESFARKYGLIMLTWTLNIFFITMLFVLCYVLGVYLYTSGLLTAPETAR